VTGRQRNQHKEEFHNLHFSPEVIRVIKSSRIRRAGQHVACMGVMRIAYTILVGKPEGKRPLCRWEDNIKMDLKETGLEGVDWIHMAQDRDQ
jgi:hypothetical protein